MTKKKSSLPQYTSDGTWEAYGGTWSRPEPVIGTPIPKCETCGHGGGGWVTFGGEGSKNTIIGKSYTVSDHHKVIVQDIASAADASLFALAPQLARFVAEIATDDPMQYMDNDYRCCSFCQATEDRIGDDPPFVAHATNCLWRHAKELVRELNKPLHVWGEKEIPSRSDGGAWSYFDGAEDTGSE